MLRAASICCLWILAGAGAAAAAAEPRAAETLAFRIDEGHNINSFLREGPVAAHLLLRSGTEPRILVAFPAGNSGVGLWFHSTKPLNWTLVAPPKPIHEADSKQRALHGIEFEVTTDAAELRLQQAVLSSIRVLRDFELLRKAPAEVLVQANDNAPGLTWSRDRLDGAAGYKLGIEAIGDAQLSAQRFASGNKSPLRLRIRALTGETPLKPLLSPLSAAAADDTRARNALGFLSYQDKFLAGSWRFDTYFGRDTLISALLLAPVLEPPAMESAISSVLERLAPNGEVAHEEDIGEFAVLRNAREGRGRAATPVYDYGMVDDDFLLAPLAAHWLLDDARGRGNAQRFLARRGASGETNGRLLLRNLAWLTEAARPFSENPRARNLIAIKAGRLTGNWRDSEQGLGRGRYAYDINAALVPAALEAAAKLQESGLLDAYSDDTQKRTLRSARGFARVWNDRAAPMFAVDIPAAKAGQRIEAHARAIGVNAKPVTRANQPLRFNALSLDDAGEPIPILHSDEGFRLLLTRPLPEELARCIDAIFQTFPAGLLSEAGLLVANPAFATQELQGEFSRFAYHGTVVWSWQQALMAAGLERQLRREDLPEDLRQRLRRARSDLWAAIDRSKALRTSELWSWSYSQGRYRIEPFGRPGADADESNAAQLWSTVFLGIKRPD